MTVWNKLAVILVVFWSLGCFAIVLALIVNQHNAKMQKRAEELLRARNAKFDRMSGLLSQDDLWDLFEEYRSLMNRCDLQGAELDEWLDAPHPRYPQFKRVDFLEHYGVLR